MKQALALVACMCLCFVAGRNSVDGGAAVVVADFERPGFDAARATIVEFADKIEAATGDDRNAIGNELHAAYELAEYPLLNPLLEQLIAADTAEETNAELVRKTLANYAAGMRKAVR